MALLQGGCALRNGDVTLGGKLRVELSPATGPWFYGVRVQPQQEGLFITGFGKQPQPPGQIVLALVAPTGEPLVERRVDPLPPLPVPNRTYNYRFECLMTITPPPNSTLRISYESTPQ